MKKRFISLFLALVITTLFIACGADKEEGTSVTDESLLTEEPSNETSDTTSEQSSIIEETADRTGIRTCVTLGCSYEASRDPISSYPDDGKLLTDGRFNTVCLNTKGFTGYKAGEAFEITVDLGAAVEGLCDFEIYYLVKSGVSREPASFTVSVSPDGVEYTEAGTAECAERTVRLLDRQYHDTLELENTVKGRYIKFSFKPKTGFSVLLEEVCAFKYINADIHQAEISDEQKYTSAPADIAVPHVSYSFVTGLPLAGCTEEEADEYFDNLQTAGIEGLIILNGAGYDGSIMSEEAFGTIFAQCEKRRMKVFMGLNMAEKDPCTTEGYADTFLSIAKTTAKTLYAKYKAKYPNAFYGWYFNTELNNSVYSSSPDACVKLLNGFIDIFNEIDDTMPMLMSPFTASWAGGADNLKTDLSGIMKQVNFRSFDIYCPQDSVGAGLVGIDASEAYLAAAKACCDEKGIHFWANLENFVIKSDLPGCDDTVPAHLSRFIQQMDIASKYAETLATFTFEAYTPEDFGNYTIFNDNDYYYDKYIEYLNTGAVSETSPTGLDVIVQDAEDGYLYITVYLKTPSYGVSDLAVTRNGVYSSLGRYLVGEKGDTSYISFRDKIADENNTGIKYKFVAYDFSSAASAPKYYGYNCEIDELFVYEIDRTLEKHNVALGCSYTGSASTHSNGDSGGELTDGVYGKPDFSDPAWSGYSDTKYEFTIDLGTVVEGIADFNVSLLGGGIGAINEPKSIKFAVSSDGTSFFDAGEVKYTAQSGNTLYATSMGVQLELGAAARYVKVTVDCYGWCFIDEIEVYKYE